jgi:hypothetical protein
LKDCKHWVQLSDDDYLYHSQLAEDPETLQSSTRGDIELLGPRANYGLERKQEFFQKVDPIINFKTISGWIDQCNDHHICSKGGLGAHGQNLKSPPSITLVDVIEQCLADVVQHVEYLCLSYLWGHEKTPFTTTKSNVGDLHQPGALKKYQHKIPSTILDAITLTRILGIRYLWIDRLCIVQDDDQKKQEQIGYMAAIYAGSYFTIVAASGSNNDHGLPGVTVPRKLSRPILQFNDTFLAVDVGEADEERDVWHSRAWTYQERLVSRRCLVFHGNTFKWECKRATWPELVENYRRAAVGKQQLRIGSGPDLAEFDRLVFEYSDRSLTYQGDAMRAFSAILTSLAPCFPGIFLFGLPEFYFNIALLWTGQKGQIRRTEFPSWSWLGWKGTSKFDCELLESFLYHYHETREVLYNDHRPLVQWLKEDVRTRKLKQVEESYYDWQSYTNDLQRDPPSGWRRKRVSDRGAAAACVYLHDKFRTEEGWGVLHPVPVEHNNDEIQPIDFHDWASCLRGRVKIVKVNLGQRYRNTFNETDDSDGENHHEPSSDVDYELEDFVARSDDDLEEQQEEEDTMSDGFSNYEVDDFLVGSDDDEEDQMVARIDPSPEPKGVSSEIQGGSAIRAYDIEGANRMVEPDSGGALRSILHSEAEAFVKRYADEDSLACHDRDRVPSKVSICRSLSASPSRTWGRRSKRRKRSATNTKSVENAVDTNRGQRNHHTGNTASDSSGKKSGNNTSKNYDDDDDDDISFHILDNDGQLCGTLRANAFDASTHQEGAVCEVIPISRGMERYTNLDKPLADLFKKKNSFHTIGPEVIYDRILDETVRVMWIRWGNGIAYRQGVGVLTGQTFDRLDSYETDIVLG